jgi:p-hydroxybenzoate 3-monooxygenase
LNLLVDSGISDRVLREGDRHDGIELRFKAGSVVRGYYPAP